MYIINVRNKDMYFNGLTRSAASFAVRKNIL